MKKLITLSICIFSCCQILFAQQKIAELLDIAIANDYKGSYQGVLSPPIVSYKPLKKASITKEKYWSYKGHMEEWTAPQIDSLTLMELIENAGHLDSAFWTQQELQNAIVDFGDSVINFKSVRQHLRHISGPKKKAFKEAITHYNSTPKRDRTAISFSRPIFNRKGDIALVEYYSEKGAFGDVAYRFENGHWTELGIVALIKF